MARTLKFQFEGDERDLARATKASEENLEDVEQQAKETGRALDESLGAGGTNRFGLTLDGLGAVGRGLGFIGGAAIGAVGGIAALAFNTGSLLIDLQNMSRITGLPLNFLYALEQLAEREGVEFEPVLEFFTRVSELSFNALQGDEGAVELIGKLGIYVNDIADLDPVQLFTLFAEALNNIEDPIKRNAIAAELFSTDFRSLDIILGEAGTSLTELVDPLLKNEEELNNNVTAARELREQWNIAKQNVEDFAFAITADLVVALNDAVIKLRDNILEYGIWNGIVETAVELSRDHWAEVGKTEEEMAKLEQRIRLVFGALETLGGILAGVVEGYNNLLGRLQDNVNELGTFNGIMQTVGDTLWLLFGALGPVGEALEDVLFWVGHQIWTKGDDLVRILTTAFEALVAVLQVLDSIGGSILDWVGNVIWTVGDDLVRGLSTAFDGLVAVLQVLDTIGGGIRAFFQGIYDLIVLLIGQVGKLATVLSNLRVPEINIPSFPNLSSFFSGVPGFATGGIVTQPTLGVIGEAGPEAVVPLDQYNQSMGGGPQRIDLSLSLRGGAEELFVAEINRVNRRTSQEPVHNLGRF